MSQTRRPAARSLFVALALTLTAAPTADAVPLTVQSELELRVTPDGPVALTGPGIAKHRLDGEHATPGGSGAVWRGVATAETGLGNRPFATVRADSFSTLAVTSGGTRVNAPGESFAFADLAYQVVLTSIVPPPVPLLFVPMKVEARGSVTTASVGDPSTNFVHAIAGVDVDGFGVIDISLFDPGERTEEVAVEFLREPGQIIDVTVRVLARAGSGGNTTGPLQTSAVVTAFADPIFTLDQAAFDEMARQQGFAPFDLSLYFRFEQAGALVATVAAAPAWVLVLAVAAVPAGRAAAGARRRGRRSARFWKWSGPGGLVRS
jgi:hypothetical protein